MSTRHTYTRPASVPRGATSSLLLVAMTGALAASCLFESPSGGVGATDGSGTEDTAAQTNTSSTAGAATSGTSGDDTCQDGDTKPLACNTCVCVDSSWACTKRGCDPTTSAGSGGEVTTSSATATATGGECMDGEVRDDPCNQCSCAGGFWACTTRACTHEPCRGKSCGDPCTLCDPMDASCVETTDLKTCDTDGQCTGTPKACEMAHCGGFGAIACPKGQRCIDDPTDDCDPRNGGADCGGVCVSPTSCDGIADRYDEIVTVDDNVRCSTDTDCRLQEGHCSMGLGGCFYALNQAKEPQAALESLAKEWQALACQAGVCDCATPGKLSCANGRCHVSF